MGKPGSAPAPPGTHPLDPLALLLLHLAEKRAEAKQRQQAEESIETKAREGKK